MFNGHGWGRYIADFRWIDFWREANRPNRQQTVDKVWSGAAKDLVMAALASSGGSPATQAVTGIDCRAGMCRVEIVADANHEATTTPKLPVSVGPAMPYLVSATKYTDGVHTKSSVLFISEDPIGDQ
jgi:hypothetical protein